MSEETPERERKRRRIMRALDTNPLLCQPCNIRFFDYYDAAILQASKFHCKEFKGHWPPANCPLPNRWRELFDDPPKLLRFPGKRARAARSKKTTPG